MKYTSVPVNTELRFQSPTMWHNYVLSKCQLDNQSKKEHESLETSEVKWTCFNLQYPPLSRMPHEYTPIISQNNANFSGPNNFVMMSAIWSSVAICTLEISLASSRSQICLNLSRYALYDHLSDHSWWALGPHGCQYEGASDLSMSCLGSRITICAIVSQTSFGHISTNSSMILTVSMATESP